MGRYRGYAFGKLEVAKNIRTGGRYADWRSGYVGKAGLIALYESQLGHGYYVQFYPAEQFEGEGEKREGAVFLRTSYGKFRERKKEGVILMKTEHSYYEFKVGDFGIDRKRKKRMLREV